MTKILTDNPKDIIFVFDSQDIYFKPIKIRYIIDEETGYELSLNSEEALELGTKLIDLANQRKPIEEILNET